MEEPGCMLTQFLEQVHLPRLFFTVTIIAQVSMQVEGVKRRAAETNVAPEARAKEK